MPHVCAESHCTALLPTQAIADELSAFEARVAEGSTSSKAGGGSNMAFFLSLSSGEFVGKDTGVESTAQDALLALPPLRAAWCVQVHGGQE